MLGLEDVDSDTLEQFKLVLEALDADRTDQVSRGVLADLLQSVGSDTEAEAYRWMVEFNKYPGLGSLRHRDNTYSDAYYWTVSYCTELNCVVPLPLWGLMGGNESFKLFYGTRYEAELVLTETYQQLPEESRNLLWKISKHDFLRL